MFQEEQIPPVEVYQTPCCALAFLSANNNNSIEEIQEEINRMKKEAYSRNFYTPGRQRIPYGQKSCMIVVSVGEDVLERNLIKLGFSCIVDGVKNNNFPRRHGYKPGQLKLYYLNFAK